MRDASGMITWARWARRKISARQQSKAKYFFLLALSFLSAASPYNVFPCVSKI